MERREAGRAVATVAGTAAPRLLSERELVATGATNREIAAALLIAPKTASAHIEHILRKLGAAHRSQIAAWIVLRRG